MTKSFRFLFFATCIVFTYMTTAFTTGRGVADILRWVLLGVLCLYGMWSPRAVAGSFGGGGVRVAAFIFAALALASSTWSSEKSIYTLMRGMSVVLLVVFLFLSLWPRLRRVKDYAALVRILSIVSWTIVLLSMAVYVFARGVAVRPFTGAFQGIFGNPNMLGMVFAVLMPVAVARFHYRKGPITLALPAVIFAFLIASQSRAGALGGALGTGAFYAGYYGKKIWLVVIVVFAVAVPYLVFKDQGNVLEPEEAMFMRGESDVNEYGSGRLRLWTTAFERFKRRPFTGYGFGTGGDVYLPNGEPFRWHSSFTQITVELGIGGLLFFVAPITYSGVKVFRYHFVAVRSHAARAVIAGLMAGWIGGAVDSFFESWLFSVGNLATLLAWACFVAGVKAMSDATILAAEGEANAKR